MNNINVNFKARLQSHPMVNIYNTTKVEDYVFVGAVCRCPWSNNICVFVALTASKSGHPFPPSYTPRAARYCTDL